MLEKNKHIFSYSTKNHVLILGAYAFIYTENIGLNGRRYAKSTPSTSNSFQKTASCALKVSVLTFQLMQLLMISQDNDHIFHRDSEHFIFLVLNPIVSNDPI